MLLGVWGLAAEVGIGLAVLPLVLPSSAQGSQVAAPSGVSHFRYRNRLVGIYESGPLLMVIIDGRMVHVDRSPTRYYQSHLLPFREFADLRALLRTLIDMASDHLVIL
jgi:hypothetical protein